MISFIITAYKEAKTIGRAVEAVYPQLKKGDEIMIVAPDEETIEAALKFKRKFSNIRAIKDSGEGKPAALNLAVSKTKGDILILSDGDVYIDNYAIEKMCVFFKEDNVGAVSGRPVSLNSKNNLLGYWAYVLTEVANSRRIYASKNRLRFFCSGYLFAIRRNLFPELPKWLFSEDGFISSNVYNSNRTIRYSEDSKVYVKYPINLSDWIKQKRRSAGGYNQMRRAFNLNMRSFKSESLGAIEVISYSRSLKELVWLMSLFVARVYLWGSIYLEINIRKKSHKDIWVRVESTK